jgi:hypothetical protein
MGKSQICTLAQTRKASPYLKYIKTSNDNTEKAQTIPTIHSFLNDNKFYQGNYFFQLNRFVREGDVVFLLIYVHTVNIRSDTTYCPYHEA